MTTIEVGAAQAPITGAIRQPRYPVPRGAMRTHDEITATVLAVRRGAHRYFLYSLDTLAIYRPLYRQLQRTIAEAFATSADRVVLFASHNHSAEAEGYSDGTGFRVSRLAGILLRASERALKGAVPVSLGHRRVRVGERVQVNRRCYISPRMGSLSVVFNDLCRRAGDTWDATRQVERYVSNVSGRRYAAGHRLLLNGRVDPTLDCVVFRRRDGSVLASWVNFAMHPVIVSKRIGAYFSSDYVHDLRRAVEKRTGAPMFFTAGTCGNMRPNHRAHTFGECRRIGEVLAGSALGTLAGMRFEPLTRVRARRATVRYPLRRDVKWDAGAARRDYAGLKAELERAVEERADFARIKRLADRMQVYENNVLLRRRCPNLGLAPGELKAGEVGADLTRLQFNDLDVIALPGEIFCEIGKRIRTEAARKYGATVITAESAFMYYFGYLPSAREFLRGGYEQTACLSGGEGDRLLVKKALSLLRR